jgi:hypothetical protein
MNEIRVLKSENFFIKPSRFFGKNKAKELE